MTDHTPPRFLVRTPDGDITEHDDPKEAEARAKELAGGEFRGSFVDLYSHAGAVRKPVDEPRAVDAAGHDIYKNGDPDMPKVIQDRDGAVVLALCKRCGRGESELVEPCAPRTKDRRANREGR